MIDIGNISFEMTISMISATYMLSPTHLPSNLSISMTWFKFLSFWQKNPNLNNF